MLYSWWGSGAQSQLAELCVILKQYLHLLDLALPAKAKLQRVVSTVA